MASDPGSDFPEGFHLWPKEIQEQWLDAYRALYFPRPRWWEKPETLDEDSGPRPSQLPPDHPRHPEADLSGYKCGCTGNPDWYIWLLLTGRGWGKTKTGSNWVVEMALSKPGIHVGVCAPTYEAVRSIAFEGESGIIAEARRNSVEITDYNKNRLEITFANDSKVRGFSAEKPDSIRGENLSYCWFDELAVIRYMAFYHEGLMPALRKGENPRMVITTTPKRIRLLRDLLADAENEAETGVHLTRGHSAQNPHFARRQREALERKYAGTFLLKQELEGELVGELDGCLFPLEQFNETRVFPGKDSLPQWRRVVVAIDPATTAKDSSDETGIVVAAEGDDGDYYVLEDCSGRYGPDQQMRVVAEAYYRNAADCVVGEVNMTGDYMRALLNTVDPNIPLRTVHGMKGKVARAQGPSSLFAQGRIHMVGDAFGKLEDQLSAMAEGDDRSRMHDDRADAFCLADGTPVLTPQGDVPIECIVPGDLVWTRRGWRPVLVAACTQRNAEVITVILSDGRELTGTGNHRVWTENDGWKRLDALVWGDILSGWKKPLSQLSSKVTYTGVIQTVRTAATGSTTSTIRPAESGTCTATSGLPRTRARKSRKAGIFTTRTRTRSITTRLISSFYRQPSTVKSIPETSPGKRRIFSTTWTASGRWPQSGTALNRGVSGTSSMASAPGRFAGRFLPVSARSAVPSSSPCGPMRSCAPVAASTVPAIGTRSTSRLSPARSAALNTSGTNTARGVVRPAVVSVAGSFARSGRRDVYDLTVADVHEFTASGVIVHNCWALIHLAGANQGDWGAVYGFRDCVKCGARVNEDKDQRCANCGAEITPLPPKHAGGRPAREPWSVAYLRECGKCGNKYTPRERSCPKCSATPETYLAQAMAMQSGNGGRLSYTGKNWMAGRRF